MVCGLQLGGATHERTAATITTIDRRHRWAVAGGKYELKSVETGSLACMKRRTPVKSVQLEVVTLDG